MKHISIVTACYNEAQNVKPLHECVRSIFAALPQYTYEHIFIDNASKDGTATVLREMAARDSAVKVILNTRNFGHIRSPYHALLQAHGDAVISLVADFQDPPQMIVDLLGKWEDGYKIVLAVKDSAEESRLMFAIRSLYYRLVSALADIELIRNFTGFGLYDQQVISKLREIDDPYPYFRGLIADVGFESCKLPYVQPVRRSGITKNNFYTLYDMAMLGITNHSKIPLRIATLVGFLMSGVSLLIALGYLVAKLILWYHFPVGIAPMLISMFFFSSVQLFFIGVIGEYIAAIHTQVQKRPLVVEKERINFGSMAGDPIGCLESAASRDANGTKSMEMLNVHSK